MLTEGRTTLMPFRRNSRNFRDSRCICGAPRKGSTARRLYRMCEMEERRELVTRARRWSPGVAYDNGRDYGAYYIFAGCCYSGGIPGEELLRVERGRSVSPFHLCYLHSGWVLSAFLFVWFVWLCWLVFCLLLVGSSFTQCNSCLPTARGSLPLTRAGILTEQSTFSDRRSFVRVAAVAQKKKDWRANCPGPSGTLAARSKKKKTCRHNHRQTTKSQKPRILPSTQPESRLKCHWVAQVEKGQQWQNQFLSSDAYLCLAGPSLLIIRLRYCSSISFASFRATARICWQMESTLGNSITVPSCCYRTLEEPFLDLQKWFFRMQLFELLPFTVQNKFVGISSIVPTEYLCMKLKDNVYFAASAHANGEMHKSWKSVKCKSWVTNGTEWTSKAIMTKRSQRFGSKLSW